MQIGTISYLRNMKILAALVIGFLLVGCSKTPLLESTDALEGIWIHYTSEVNYHKIIINADGTGSMEWFVDNKKSRATKVRDWYLDDNFLSFGKAAFNGESYMIDKYPTFTWEELIKYYDTIPATSYYMILDDYYYVGQ